MFKSLYGAGRNTSEGGNAHHRNTYPHKRAQAVGRIPILLDVHLYFIYDNAKTWYFQEGWRVVDPLVHGSSSESEVDARTRKLSRTPPSPEQSWLNS